MNHLVLFVFVLIGSSVADNDSAFGCHKKFMGQLSALSSNSNSAACGYFVDYIKCYIRAMDWDNVDEIEEYYEPFESDLNDQMRQQGFDCPIDISEIFDELRNAGSTSSPIGWLVAMVTSSLVMLQQLNVI